VNQGGYVTLVGYVAREPTIRQTKDGTQVADMRMGTASRYFDKRTQTWQDGDQSYFTVTFWRKLAATARASLHKGDPCIVRGRFRTRTFPVGDGQQHRTEVEVVAETFGHDLTRGVATFLYNSRLRPAERERPGADDETPAEPARDGQTPPEEDPGDEGSMSGGGLRGGVPPTGVAGLAVDITDQDGDVVRQILDVSAVAQFTEDLADEGALERELAGSVPAVTGETETGEPVGVAAPF